MFYIYGAGSHSNVVYNVFKKNYKINIKNFIDDNKNGLLNKILIKKPKEIFNKINDIDLHIAIGDNLLREKIYNKFKKKIVSLKTIIDKDSYIYKTSIIKDGCFIAPRSILGPNTIINHCCIINHGAIVDHDSKVGAFSHIAPGCVIGGNVQIGKKSLLGSNCVVLPNIVVGNNVTIGAGSVITKNIPNDALVFGNPGRIK